MGRMAFALVTVFVFAVAGLSLDEVIRQKGTELLSAEAALVAAEEVNKELSLEVAALTSPQNIAMLAEEKFGMVVGGADDRVLYVSRESVEESGNESFGTENGVLAVLGELLF